MRYPMLAFLFVFVLGPYTAHAMLTGGARIQPRDPAEPVVHRTEKIAARSHLGGGVLVSIGENGLRRGYRLTALH
jgi:hypothetical protein